MNLIPLFPLELDQKFKYVGKREGPTVSIQHLLGIQHENRAPTFRWLWGLKAGAFGGATIIIRTSSIPDLEHLRSRFHSIFQSSNPTSRGFEIAGQSSDTSRTHLGHSSDTSRTHLGQTSISRPFQLQIERCLKRLKAI